MPVLERHIGGRGPGGPVISTREMMSGMAAGGGDVFDLVGKVLAEKFRIDRAVAEGGFGVVYAGHHLGLDIAVAIKVLKTPREFGAEASAAFIERFVLEAKTIAKVRHPNIVQVLDTGVAPETARGPAPFMVLEWLSGEPFDRVLRERRGRGGQSPRDVLSQLGPALEALEYAHDLGVAHRDIKPANIMLVPTKRGPVVRVLDFGIAKIMDEDEQASAGITKTKGTSAFSPSYAAPEQISGTRTGPWTDVHALGLIFTEMLIGRPPYHGKQLTDSFQDVLSPTRPTPLKFGCDVGPLEPVLAKAVAFRPDERYANAGQFLDALRSTVGSIAVVSQRTPSSGIRLAEPIESITLDSAPSPTTLNGHVHATQGSSGNARPDERGRPWQ